jgi:hypothetical protein
MPSEPHKAFPLSKAVKSTTGNFDISPVHHLLELGTNAGLQWSKFTPSSLALRINQLYFRSVLDILLNKFVPNASQYIFHTHKIKTDKPFDDFRKYVSVTLPKLRIKNFDPSRFAGNGRALPATQNKLTLYLYPRPNESIDATELFPNWLDISLEIEAAADATEAHYARRKKQIGCFLSLQMAFSHVIESLIHLDRFLYLGMYLLVVHLPAGMELGSVMFRKKNLILQPRGKWLHGSVDPGIRPRQLAEELVYISNKKECIVQSHRALGEKRRTKESSKWSLSAKKKLSQLLFVCMCHFPDGLRAGALNILL